MSTVPKHLVTWIQDFDKESENPNKKDDQLRQNSIDKFSPNFVLRQAR